MARKGPPVSVFGLGSQVSSWLAPPASQTTSICFWPLAISAVAEAPTNGANPDARPRPASPPRKPLREVTCSADRQE